MFAAPKVNFVALRHGLFGWRYLPRLQSPKDLSRKQTRMHEAIAPTPKSISTPENFDWGRMPEGKELGLGESRKTNLQIGGSTHADETLRSFLEARGVNYRSAMRFSARMALSLYAEVWRMSPNLSSKTLAAFTTGSAKTTSTKNGSKLGRPVKRAIQWSMRA